ncbi:MAG TPA: LuxR C-terminal-related transcriptional regulator [Burkholderiales bacterium]|nr:LuxR C-terminal-related transcriptional regulator [Burkholderiales bacterium]
MQSYQKGPFALTAAVPGALAWLAAGDDAAAERRLQQVFTTPGAQVDRLLLVSAFLCRAQLAQHRGEEEQALDVIVRARELAGDEIIVPFVRAAPALAPLLARHPEIAERWPAAVPVPGDGAEQTAPAQNRLLEPLTERERAVLRLLTGVLSAGEIAEELVVSPKTVKTHIAAIYRKLGVSRRREAVLRARQLELL